ncbi:MAG: hypothetical protein QJR14_05245 [Bacillota bacterium]|nr:hypothetical protein [Bacillota bacterium]
MDKRWKRATALSVLAGLLLGTVVAAARLPAGEAGPGRAPRVTRPAGPTAGTAEARPAMAPPGKTGAAADRQGVSRVDLESLRLPPLLDGWARLALRDPRAAVRTMEALARTPLYRPTVGAALATPSLREALGRAAGELRRRHGRPDAAWVRATLAQAGGEGWMTALDLLARDAGKDPTLERQLRWTLQQPGASPLRPWVEALLAGARAERAGGRG